MREAEPMTAALAALRNDPFDIVVIGAGGAGMAAALFALIEGARVLLVERTAFVGGTTAYSGGTTWIPSSHHAASVAQTEDRERAAAFLRHAVGHRPSEAMRRAFLEHGPAALAHIEANSEVRYRAYPTHPDYLSELEGSTLRGRALEPLPFDGRKLDPLLGLVRPPIPEFTVLGGMMVDRTDIGHLLRLTKSWTSFRHALGLLARHASDRLRHPRGTRLVMGNALVARLLLSLKERGVSLLMETRVERLLRDERGIRGLVLIQGETRREIGVEGGVILASGGFNRGAKHRAAMLPEADPAWCPGAPGHTGEAQDLALAVGARYGEAGLSHAFWAPVSTRRRADGLMAVFPHFLMDRGKPGVIAVDRTGRRFVCEATSYHLFALAMQKAGAVPAYLITDAAGLRKYGLGMVRPGGWGLKPFLNDGYLTKAPTLTELAAKLGIDAAGLEASVARMNGFAESGQDADFGRGSTDYQRAQGDSAHGPNPSLGPIRTAPFYAVRLYPGDIGATTGLRTDTDARALDGDGKPIPGLYAVGNDMHSVMGGVYPGPGITLGPGLTFAYLAARHAASRAKAAIRANAA
jgi:succinate dehydrogenase/fumarate reductase flavoprotein subunit